MAKKTRTRKSSKPKRDIAQQVTDTIIESIEAGVMPWECPFDRTNADGSFSGFAFPVNAKTGRAYNGVNVLILWTRARAEGYTRDRWLTFKQAKEAAETDDGGVRRGEKGTQVVFWKPWSKQEEDENTGEKKTKRGLLMKCYTVFNVEQCDGLPDALVSGPIVEAPKEEPKKKGDRWARLEVPEAFFDSIEADERDGGNRAFYSPASDFIKLPKRGSFKSAPGYYGTKAHEYVHWTGHASRLDRDDGMRSRFGSEAYAAEELVAELGAAFLSVLLGVKPITRTDMEDHSAYVKSWLKVLKNDNRAIITAASKAKQAAEYLCKAGGLECPWGLKEGAEEAPKKAKKPKKRKPINRKKTTKRRAKSAA